MITTVNRTHTISNNSSAPTAEPDTMMICVSDKKGSPMLEVASVAVDMVGLLPSDGPTVDASTCRR